MKVQHEIKISVTELKELQALIDALADDFEDLQALIDALADNFEDLPDDVKSAVTELTGSIGTDK